MSLGEKVAAAASVVAGALLGYADFRLHGWIVGSDMPGWLKLLLLAG